MTTLLKSSHLYTVSTHSTYSSYIFSNYHLLGTRIEVKDSFTMRKLFLRKKTLLIGLVDSTARIHFHNI